MTESAMERSGGKQDPSANPLTARFKWVRGFFYATAIGDLLLMIGSGLFFTVDLDQYAPEIDFVMADWFLIFGGLIYTIAFIGSIILFCMFSFRAMKNLHVWKSRYAEMRPGWTVGWYFIPIANLWKPFQAMSQIWDGTEEVAPSKAGRYPPLGAWWFFWIITNISANISFRIALRGGYTETAIKSAAALDIVSAITGIVAIILIIPIMQKIAEMQDAKIKGEVFG